jgi:hypothetical protein
MMTAITILIALALVLAVLDRWRNSSQKLQERRVVIEEQRMAPAPTPIQNDPIPSLLIVMAQSESEEWAVADSMKAFEEGRAKLGSWNPIAAKAIGNALRAERWDILS